MKLDRYLPPEHPLSKIYRVGAAVFGAGLIVFGVLGLANRLQFLYVTGVEIFGLSTNGLLSIISIIVGLILLGAAVWGGVVASTTTATLGVLFFLSGLVNLAVLNTSFNLLGFKLPNVVFSLVAGMLLMFVGFYGRVSGGLPFDNPFVLYRHHEPPGGLSEQQEHDRERIAELGRFTDAEIAYAEGHPTLEQERLIRAEAWRHAQEERRRAYEHYARIRPRISPYEWAGDVTRSVDQGELTQEGIPREEPSRPAGARAETAPQPRETEEQSAPEHETPEQARQEQAGRERSES